MSDAFILNQLIVRNFDGLCDHQTIWQKAINFSKTRDENTADEIWLLECTPIFTLGTTNLGKYIIGAPGDIPVIQTDRTGGPTYHGPGQLIFSTLLDLNRLNIKPIKLVYVLYHMIMQLLADYKIVAQLRDDQHRTGPFIEGKKIAAIDFGLTNGCCYHGLSFNVDMDLSPYTKIDLCGMKDFTVTHLRDYVDNIDWQAIKKKLINSFAKQMGYAIILWEKARGQ